MYVVLEAGFEYNDEIYHRAESSGGTPVKAFKLERRAKEYADNKNLERVIEECRPTSKWSRGGGLGDYGYDWEDILKPEGVEVLNKWIEMHNNGLRALHCPDMDDEDFDGNEPDGYIYTRAGDDLYDFPWKQVPDPILGELVQYLNKPFYEVYEVQEGD